MNCDLFDFVIDDDFRNHRLHSIIKIIVQSPCSTLNDLLPFQGVDRVDHTRRNAAGWLVLPFQGERMTVTIAVTHKRKTP
ncbi:MAG: hypothetical protein LBG58_00340 [Planctomycetaceae bacterium]|nr:hypothetical protein [Planctomycetaceae bacterium]